MTRPGQIPGRAALAVAAIVALLAAGLLVVSPPATYTVTAFFPRAIGLFERSTVRVLGVEVGRVTVVSPEGDRVRVEMEIEDGVRVPRDATAVIVPIALISDRYVQLTPVWTAGPALADGDEIPLERGVAPAELDDLLATLRDFVLALEPGTPEEPGALGRFIQNAEQALAGQGPALGETIDTVTTLLDVLARNVSSVDVAILNLDRLFAELAQHDAALRATNRGLATVTGALAQETDALASGPGHLADLVAELGDLVRTHRGILEEDLSILANVSDVLVRQQDRILETVLWLPVLSQGAQAAFDPEFRRVRVRDWLFPGIAP